MKSLILISSVIVLYFQTPRLVYVCKKNAASSIFYDEKNKATNVYIDNKVVKGKLKQGIELYIAYFFVENKDKLAEDFISKYKQSPRAFGCQHKMIISKVIYYLEHKNHGNLPLIYGREAYVLLDVEELKPAITSVKKSLENDKMYLIDIENGEKAEDIEMRR